MAEPEQEEYQVVDKRRVAREQPQSQAEAAAAETPAAEEDQTAAAEAPTSAAGAEETPDADEFEAAAEEGEPALGPTNAVDLVQMCLGMLNEIAWVKMGLVPDPMTGVIAADLDQARLAIDCAGDLVHRLEPYVDGRTKRDLEVLVQNLKMNFVRRSVGGSP